MNNINNNNNNNNNNNDNNNNIRLSLYKDLKLFVSLTLLSLINSLFLLSLCI